MIAGFSIVFMRFRQQGVIKKISYQYWNAKV